MKKVVYLSPVSGTRAVKICSSDPNIIMTSDGW